MPRKNSLKVYVRDAFYHLYNRGVEKRQIFIDDEDYRTFLFNLKKCLLPPKKWKKKPHWLPEIFLGELEKKINLIAYCLMPNHFHFLVKQKSEDGITKLISKVCTSYTMYFNKRNNRVGSLFQGVYKAVMLETDEQLLHLSRYIHLNPSEEGVGVSQLAKYPYSSYPVYLGLRKTVWVKPLEVLSFFKNFRRRYQGDLSYQSFVEEYKKDFGAIAQLAIDKE